MLIVIEKVPTTVELVNTLNHHISEYHALNEQHETAVRTANESYKTNAASGIYTDEHLKKTLYNALDRASTEFTAQATSLNARMREYVDTIKQKIFNALHTVTKPADYETQISNAFAFIQSEGADITDETAAEILKKFLADPDTMRRFRSIIERQKGEAITDAYGNTTFPQTFGQLQKYEKFAAAFDELTETIDKLFTRPKTETDAEYLRSGVKLSVPMDSYMQLVGEKNAATEAATIETMLSELFEVSA